jgi:hypothetical protein
MLVRAIAILAHASFGFAFHSNTVDLATFFVAHHAFYRHQPIQRLFILPPIFILPTPSAAKAGTDFNSRSHLFDHFQFTTFFVAINFTAVHHRRCVLTKPTAFSASSAFGSELITRRVVMSLSRFGPDLYTRCFFGV